MIQVIYSPLDFILNGKIASPIVSHDPPTLRTIYQQPAKLEAHQIFHDLKVGDTIIAIPNENLQLFALGKIDTPDIFHQYGIATRTVSFEIDDSSKSKIFPLTDLKEIMSERGIQSADISTISDKIVK